MATAEELLVRIDATTESLRRELRRGDQAVGQFSSSVQSRLGSIDKSFAGLTAGIGKVNGLLGALGVGVSVGALVNLGRSALQLADDLQDIAAQLGVSTDALQVFRFAAAETGVDAGQLDQALLKLNTTIGDAASGDEAAEKKFKALGIAFTDASGAARASEAVLADLANIIQALPTPAERAAAAAALLGERAGPRLVPLLAGGAKGLEDYARAADRAGQVMDKSTIESLAKAQREIEKFSARLTIGAGEILSFIDELDMSLRRDNAEAKLGRVNDELERLSKTIAEIKANPDPLTAGLDAETLKRSETALRDLRLQQQLLQDVLGINRPQGHAGRNANTPSSPPAVTMDLGDDETDAAAKKLEAAIDSARLNIAQAQAEFADDPLGKALVENFSRAGLALDDYSAKAEQLRVLTELLVEVETRQAIATEAVTAARDADREAVAEWTKVQEEGKQLTDDLRTPTDEYAATVERLNFLLGEGAISAETYARALAKAKDDLGDADEKTKEFKDATEDAAQVIGTAFEDAVLNGEDLRGVLQGLLDDIGRIVLRLSVTKPLEGLIGKLFTGSSSGGAGPGAGPGSQLAGTGSFLSTIGSFLSGLFNFADGGSFRVGGAGGTDSQLVAFRASPNERVTVTRPDQAMGGLALSVTNNISVQGSGDADADNALADQIARRVNAAVDAAVSRSIANKMRYGGALNAAFGS